MPSRTVSGSLGFGIGRQSRPATLCRGAPVGGSSRGAGCGAQACNPPPCHSDSPDSLRKPMKNHNLVEDFNPQEIIVEHRPVLDRWGKRVADLHTVWIPLNTPTEMTAHPPRMLK